MLVLAMQRFFLGIDTFFMEGTAIMKRSLLIKLLQNYNPLDSQELLFKQQILEFVQTYENCFERSLEVGHITASAWLLNKNRSHALLMHHAKLDKWFQLGGHCDGDHDVRVVALKEAQEESGIMGISLILDDIFDVDVHLIPANKKEKEHYHYDIRFLVGVTSDEQIVQNEESKELRWISKNRADLPTDARSVTRMFEKWVSKE